ncbi:MAG: hypothetical protein LC793_03185 [Thermomicrobia bacterium]|nr:hypothetical protein [Thermomicrobia bacterium]MCA1724098.1 hypothetical protein [Thermomicrobia bacterium]
MREVTQESERNATLQSGNRSRRTSLIASCPEGTRTLLIASFCGFVTVFGLAHLLLVHITKPSGYVFFGTLVVVPLAVMALLLLIARDRRGMLARFGFGALMCVCAIPFIYLARFAPERARPMVRNLLGLPFFALALIGPGVFFRIRRRNAGD